MHGEAYRFVREVVGALPPRRTVVELGGRNVNGSVRGLFGEAAYTSIDLRSGPGVDLVADAAIWRPRCPIDTVVCCEVLEHATEAEALVANAAAMLEPGGVLIVTCATDPRAPHSGIDGGPVRGGEWYRNVDPGALRAWLASLTLERFEIHAERGDLYAVGVRP